MAGRSSFACRDLSGGLQDPQGTCSYLSGHVVEGMPEPCENVAVDAPLAYRLTSHACGEPSSERCSTREVGFVPSKPAKAASTTTTAVKDLVADAPVAKAPAAKVAAV